MIEFCKKHLKKNKDLFSNIDNNATKFHFYATIIIFSIFIQTFELNELTSVQKLPEILHQLTCPTPDKKPLRPTLEDDDTVVVDPELRNLVQECWQEDPHARPDFSEIYKKFKKMKR